MTITDAKSLTSGQTIFSQPGNPLFNRGGVNADGSPMRFKVTSVKTWKTRPDEIRVGLKRGLRDTFKVDETEIQNFNLS